MTQNGSPKRNARTESPPLHASDQQVYTSLTVKTVEIESLTTKIIGKHVESKVVIGELQLCSNLREKEQAHRKYGSELENYFNGELARMVGEDE